MRQYQTAWNLLKEKGHLTLQASPQFHRRILKAIKKERVMDLGFRYSLQESYRAVEMHSMSTGSVLKISLSYKITQYTESDI